MANYSTLKAAVADVVKTNGTRAITGANLQAVLLSIINSVGGGGYIFKGVATPSTSAGTPDENVFYVGGAGTYANFGTSVTVPVGSICVFKYNGSWVKEQIKMFEGIDDVPTANSNNLVKSSGVASQMNDISNDLEVLTSKNLYTKRCAVDASDGSISSPANYYGTPYIPLDKIQNIETDGIRILEGDCHTSAIYCSVAFFDSSKNYINGEISTHDADTPIPASSIPANAKYVILGKYKQGTAPKIVLDGFAFDTIFKILETPIPTVEDTLDSTSTTSALSAKQGNVILDELKSEWSVIDVVSLTSIPMIISSTPTDGIYKWASNRSSSQQISQYRHTRIKCSAGDKFYIKANSTYDAVCAWLTTYTATYNEAVSLVDGTIPITITKDTYAFIEAPVGAEFLYIKRSTSNQTEYLPQSVLRLCKYDEEVCVPTALRKIYFDSTTNKIIDGTSDDSVLRVVKVKSGDILHFKTDYTANVNTGRPIWIGFTKDFPAVGVDATIVDSSDRYAAKVTYNDYYVAPYDGYMFVTNQYGVSYYTNYSFLRVLINADSTHPIRNENIVIFGDSILELSDSYSNNKGFAEFLSEYTGASVTKGAVGGTRLIPRNDEEWGYLDIANLIHAWVNNDWTNIDNAMATSTDASFTSKAYIITNLKAIRPSQVTMIVMDGGGNDLSNPSLSFGDETASDIFNENPSPTTLNGAINYIMRDLFTANQYLKVFWVNGLSNFAGSGTADRTKANWIDNRTYTIEGQTYTAKQYRDKIAEQVGKWKVPAISMADICINPVTFSAFFPTNDNIHPYKGFYRMASLVASQIISKDYQ